MKKQVIQLNIMKKNNIHKKWVQNYRSGLANKFYDLAFFEISKTIKSKGLLKVLDAGCGTGSKSFLLAKNGLDVVGCDFSEYVIKEADLERKKNYETEKIEFCFQDITSLTFNDSTFDAVVCWGVLMHVTDLKNALDELCRVVKPGGMLVIGINNCKSFDSRIAVMKYKIKKGIPDSNYMGKDLYINADDGDLLVRHTDVEWMIMYIIKSGFELKRRRSGQFTELYTTKYLNKSLKKILHIINNWIFKKTNMPSLSAGNILYFTKKNNL